MTKMSDTTPYSTRPAGERAREAECFRAILRTAPEVSAVLEAFGGIGDTTAVLRERFPKAHIYATELDPATASAHRERFAHDPLTGLVGYDCLEADWTRLAAPYGDAFGVILDYNLCTLKRLQDPDGFVQRIMRTFPLGNASWVTVTDAAIAKLHLNHASYGTHDLESYKYKLANTLCELLPGRWEFNEEAHHSRAMYLRLDRIG
jgi:hypothetical protein